MKKIILALAILYPAAVLAQGTSTPAAPPTVGGKPLVVVGSKKSAEGKKDKAVVARPEAAGLSGHRRRDQGTPELLRRDLFAAAQAEGSGRKKRHRVPLPERGRRTPDLLQQVLRKKFQSCRGKRACAPYQVLFQLGRPKKPNGDCCATRTGGLARTLATLRLRCGSSFFGSAGTNCAKVSRTRA